MRNFLQRILTFIKCKKTWGTVVLLFLALLLADLMFPVPVEKLTLPESQRILDINGKLIRVFQSIEGGYCFYTPLNNISEHLINATLVHEDRWFYYHPGINPHAIIRAAWMNLRAGRVVSGGSTITQQLARMIDSRPRILSAKIVEALRAFQIELHYSKSEILEYYLNMAPYGGNIYGASAASYIYFGKSSEELGPGEAALLAGIPLAPSKLRPDTNPDGAEVRRDEILKRMLNKNYIDKKQYNRSLHEDVPESRRKFPFYAPQFTQKLHLTYVDSTEIKTTIDLTIQITADKFVKRHLKQLINKGITNSSVIIIDNRTSHILAYIGSGDYFDNKNSGQVDGVVALRSPGSTLKPVIYAIGLEEGKIIPSSLLEDIPVSFGGYSPENYDETFSGQVPVSEALAKSMNVPAVNLSMSVGSTKLYETLKECGFTSLSKPSSYYGLSIVLGGVGVRLIELANLYSVFARNGNWKPAKGVVWDLPIAEKNVFSKGTCYLLSEMLSEVQRPDFPEFWKSTADLPTIAWKTGTSYGHHDAWSIGYTPEYTVGVWVGNFSGEGSVDLVGVSVAAPLLFDIINFLNKNSSSWFQKPTRIREIDVCTISGMPATELCSESKKGILIDSISMVEPCTYHRAIMIDKKTGNSICKACAEAIDWYDSTFCVYPVSITSWMKLHGRQINSIPVHNPECQYYTTGQSPKILLPENDIEIVIRKGIPLKDQQIALRAGVGNDVKVVHWFENNRLIYKGKPDTTLYVNFDIGNYILKCVDQFGREATREIRVREH